MLGSNDQTDAVSIIYAIEKILKVGILSSTRNSNLKAFTSPRNIYTEKPITQYEKPKKPKYFTFKFPPYILGSANKLQSPTGMLKRFG